MVISTALVVGAVSEPVPAVTVPGVIVRLPTGRVRSVLSTVPAALVKSVAEADRLQPAPDPRASVMVHPSEVPVEYWVLVPFRVTPDIVGAEAVAVRSPPVTVDSIVSSGVAAIAGENVMLSRMPVEARTPVILVNVRISVFLFLVFTTPNK